MSNMKTIRASDGTKKVITKRVEVPVNQYVGTLPIIVNNNTREISLDQTNMLSKTQIENELRLKLDAQTFIDNNTQVDNRIGAVDDKAINAQGTANSALSLANANKQTLDDEIPKLDNIIDVTIPDINLKNRQQDVEISTNKKNIDQLILENQKQINFKGIWNSISVYSINDSVVSNDFYYISLVDNNNQPLTNKSSWFKTSPAVSIDLSNYYTKIETNNLLKPLETRLVNIEETKANKTDVSDALALKANASDVYTQAKTNELLDTKLSIADLKDMWILEKQWTGKSSGPTSGQWLSKTTASPTLDLKALINDLDYWNQLISYPDRNATRSKFLLEIYVEDGNGGSNYGTLLRGQSIISTRANQIMFYMTGDMSFIDITNPATRFEARAYIQVKESGGLYFNALVNGTLSSGVRIMKIRIFRLKKENA